MLKTSIFGQSDKGLVRTNNEDSFLIDEQLGLLVVADGMGGHAAGEVASKLALDVMLDYLKNQSNTAVGAVDSRYSQISNRLASAIRLANTAVFEAASSKVQWEGMGTTVAAVMISDRRLSIAHVGDSRIYLIRAGNIEQITDDHTIVYEQVKRGLLSRQEAEGSEMKNILSRALGIACEVEVDLDELSISDGDMLLLCSDGLSGFVPDNDILSIMLSGESVPETCEKLIAAANRNGGRDNITVVAVSFFKSGLVARLLKFLGF